MAHHRPQQPETASCPKCQMALVLNPDGECRECGTPILAIPALLQLALCYQPQTVVIQ